MSSVVKVEVQEGLRRQFRVERDTRTVKNQLVKQNDFIEELSILTLVHEVTPRIGANLEQDKLIDSETCSHELIQDCLNQQSSSESVKQGDRHLTDQFSLDSDKKLTSKSIEEASDP